MRARIGVLTFGVALLSLAHAAPDDVAGREAFRAIYQELVEIDSSPSTGSCTKVVLAAENEAVAHCTSSFFSVIATTGRNLANKRNIMKKNEKVPIMMLTSTQEGL